MKAGAFLRPGVIPVEKGIIIIYPYFLLSFTIIIYLVLPWQGTEIWLAGKEWDLEGVYQLALSL